MVFLFWKTKIYSDGVPRETGDYQAVVADSLEDALSKMARFHPNAAISQSYPNPGIIIPPHDTEGGVDWLVLSPEF